MADDAVGRTLAALEQRVAVEVRAALEQVAVEFLRAVDDATEIVSAQFSVSSIAGMWTAQIDRIVRALMRVAEHAATAVFRALGVDRPDGWDDLPGRYDNGTLPASLGSWVTAVDGLLNAVGGRLVAAATAVVAEASAAGDSLPTIRARLNDVFAQDGVQLGDDRGQRIAVTEVTRAWNAATAAAAQDTGRTVVKRWISRGDDRVRETHRDADGQVRPIGEPFVVDFYPMMWPGDPYAPPDLTVGCRCRIAVEVADRTAAASSEREAPTMSTDSQGVREDVTAAAGHTGAMIALVPSAADAARLALPDGEPADELHLTLAVLGDADGWPQDARDLLAAAIRDRVDGPTDSEMIGRPVNGFAFGTAHWNPASDEPAWVWSVGDDRDSEGLPLVAARSIAINALEDVTDRPELPAQHSPWVAHVTAAFTPDDLREQLADRLGPIVFDRIRVAFGGEVVDIPLTPADAGPEATAAASDPAVDITPVPWDTPGPTAVAYENVETGDGRIFAPGALYWANGPWPLQYADEMLPGHDGAELAGAILTLNRDGDRIPAAGVLYPSQPAGRDAIQLLREGAPIGVSVDLDDVDLEAIDRTSSDGEDGGVPLIASLRAASVLRHADGSWTLRATHTTLTAAGPAVASVSVTTSPDGMVPAATLRAALTAAGVTLVDPAAEIARLAAEIDVTAAAGDPDQPDTGTVVHAESSGDLLVRITRARVRGATLVSVPAFADARITLAGEAVTAAAGDAAQQGRMSDVVTYVAGSPVPVTAVMAATALGITTSATREHLARAATAGLIIRLARGLYIGAATLPEGRPEVTADASGDLDLPIHDDRDAGWDGDAAAQRVADWAGLGETPAPEGAWDRYGQAFLYRTASDEPTRADFKLGFADVFDGQLHVVPRAVFAVAAALQGARGGVDIPDDEQNQIRSRVTELYERINEAFPDAPPVTPPWDDDGENMDEMEASAWSAMRSLPPMPAAWFREPTPEELPDDAPGVNFKEGRIFGWVAKAGVPHASYPGRNLTIEKLAREGIDFSNFLRQRMSLDNGETIKVGPMTMGTGHHNDGARCETASCQFDDSKTTAGIITVGISKRGLWFSGAAAPWLSQWDMSTFMACSPSYHLVKGRKGWDFRAVLSVPVPGHPTPLVAAIASVVERSNLAITAAAALADAAADPEPQPVDADDPPADVEALAAALLSPQFLDQLAAALRRREQDQAPKDTVSALPTVKGN